MLELLNNETVLMALGGIVAALAGWGIPKLGAFVKSTENKLDDAVYEAFRKAFADAKSDTPAE